MSDFLTQFAPALPEIFVLAMVSLILVIDAALDDSKRYVAYVLSLATVVGAAFLTARDFSTMPVLALGGLAVFLLSIALQQRTVRMIAVPAE